MKIQLQSQLDTYSFLCKSRFKVLYRTILALVIEFNLNAYAPMKKSYVFFLFHGKFIYFFCKMLTPIHLNIIIRNG